MLHDRGAQHVSAPLVLPVEGDRICVLLQDGRLFGPFKTREDAVYWVIAQDLQGYSTYDMRRP